MVKGVHRESRWGDFTLDGCITQHVQALSLINQPAMPEHGSAEDTSGAGYVQL
jgi:hypothetical protein